MNKLLSENINRLWSWLIIDEFLKNNITYFYLSPGMRNAPLVKAMAHAQNLGLKIKIIVCMDERAAGYRALGQAKATQIPGVLVCTSGTALANYMPAVIEAKKSQTPLIVLSADRPPELIFCDDNQSIDQSNFFGDYVQGEMNLGPPTIEISPLALTSSLSNLIFKSIFPQKGPVHLNCALREPLDSTFLQIPDDYLLLANNIDENQRPSTSYLELMTLPTEKALTDLGQTLIHSKNNLLVIGVLNKLEDINAVRNLIELLGWPVYLDISSSLKYNYQIADNAIPTFDHPEVQEALIKNPPQTILHIGGRLTSKHYYSFLKKVPSIHLITLNLNREKEDPSHHTKTRINADIKATIEALIHLPIFKKQEKQNFPISFESFAHQKIQLIEAGHLSYPFISKTILDHIFDHACLYIGNSTMVRSFDAYISFHHKKSLTIATNRGASGIEGFIASAAGFIDGLEKELYLIIGDVTFIHDLNSIYFLKDLKHPLKIILINNFGGGIFTLLPIHKEKDVLDLITSPHQQTFKKVAELIDIDYMEVKDKNSLLPSFMRMQKLKHHALMEIFVDNNQNIEMYNKLKTIKL